MNDYNNDHSTVEHGSELAVIDVQQLPDTVRTTRAPLTVLAEAQLAAAALLSVLNTKPKQVVFNGERYLENEDWQTIGHFYGITSKVESDAFVTFGDVKGFEATAIALDRTGREISRAVAMCLNDEDNWSTRSKTEWHYVTKSGGQQLDDPGKEQIVWEDKDGKKRPKKVAVKLDAPVPLFQLRSMAQTRACSRVLRQVLGFVPVLAGYRATPSEELSGSERVDTTTAAQLTKGGEVDFDKPTATSAAPKPQSKSASAPAAAQTASLPIDGEVVSEPTGDVFTVASLVKLREGDNAKGHWIKYGIITAERGKEWTVETFDEAQARVVHTAKKNGQRVRMRVKETKSTDGRFTNYVLEDVSVVDAPATRQPGEEG
jgi:hypothetical protein